MQNFALALIAPCDTASGYPDQMLIVMFSCEGIFYPETSSFSVGVVMIRTGAEVKEPLLGCLGSSRFFSHK